MVSILRLLFTLFALLLMVAPVAYAQTLSVQVDRDNLLEGESIQLEIALQGQSNASPDLSPLEQDFDIVSSSKNHTLNLFNGRMDSKTQWQIILSPKRSGTLKIPPLNIAGEITEAINITVRPSGAATMSSKQRDAFLEVTATPNDPYVQSQVLVTVRLYYALPINQARLTDPAPENSLVEKLGEDTSFETIKDGQRYKVLERIYVIFPQNSGDLIIPGLEFNGQLTVTNNSLFEQLFNNAGPGIDPFDQVLQRAKPIRLRSTPIHINVRPQPASFQGAQWLPAESLHLTEEWSQTTPGFRVGEPVTRTVTLKAKGLAAEQLPDLPLASDTTIKTYPDQAQVENHPLNRSIQGTRIQKVALVPTQPGIVSLPAIHVYWWDTLTNQERVAILPAKTITILPAPNTQPAATSAKPITKQPTPTPAIQDSRPATKTANYWLWIAVFFCAIWLVTLVIWWKDKRSRQTSLVAPQAHHSNMPTTSHILTNIQTACENNDASAAKEQLLHWAEARWPQDTPRSLGEIADRLGRPVASVALNELDKTIYASSPKASWNGSASWAILKTALAQQDQTENLNKTLLPELYPRA